MPTPSPASALPSGRSSHSSAGSLARLPRTACARAWQSSGAAAHSSSARRAGGRAASRSYSRTSATQRRPSSAYGCSPTRAARASAASWACSAQTFAREAGYKRLRGIIPGGQRTGAQLLRRLRDDGADGRPGHGVRAAAVSKERHVFPEIRKWLGSWIEQVRAISPGTDDYRTLADELQHATCSKEATPTLERLNSDLGIAAQACGNFQSLIEEKRTLPSSLEEANKMIFDKLAEVRAVVGLRRLGFDKITFGGTPEPNSEVEWFSGSD